MNNRGKIISVSFFGILILFGILLIFFMPQTKSYDGSGAGPFNCSSCDDCSAAIGNASAGATIYLNTSLADINETTCINFGSKNNVIFDCMNYSNYIQGNGSAALSTYYGISLSSIQNNTIRNCNVSGFNSGIYLYSSNNNSLNNNIVSNISQGIYLFYSSYNNLTSNIGTSNLGYGIYLSSSSNNALISNNGTSNSNYGIFLQASSNNTLTSNIGTSNSGYGEVLFSSSNNNTLISNTAISNSSTAFYLAQSSNNTLISNTAISNSSYAFSLSYSDHNLLTSNIGTGNYAFSLYFSNNNTLTSNIGTSNSSSAFLVQSSSNNTLTSNIGTTNSGNAFYVQALCNHNLLILNNGTSNSGSAFALTDSSVSISNIGTSNGNAFIILGSNNTLTSNIGTSNSSYAFYLLSGSNNTLTSNIGTSNSSYAFYLLSSSNNILTSNIGISNSSTGFFLSSSSNNTLTSNNGTSNSYIGFFLSSSSNNTLISNTGASNSSYGIYLTASSNNTLNSNIGISNSSAGFYLSYSSNNTLNNSISNNGKYGLYISNSNGTIVSNLTAKNNSLYGIFLERASYNNIIKNSFIQLNNGSAFVLNSTGIAPSNNYIYNNYFNNSAQYSNISTPAVNFFNTTKTLLSPGTNIVGGNYLGGNYWAAPNGTGFSQTCIDEGDGICNTAYSFDGINFDYLPLVCHENWSCGDWGACSCTTQTQTRTCIDAHLCQTYVFRPSETQSCIPINCQTGGHVAPQQAPSGGGGGSFTISKPIVNATSLAPIQITINSTKMDLTGITLSLKKSVENASMNITKVDQTEFLLFGLPIGKLYQLFQIEPTGIVSSDILNATLDFRINKTFLAENNITFHHRDNRYWLVQNDIVGNIAVYRMPTGSNGWMQLATNYTGEDNESYLFKAYTPGFSTFAIFFNKYDCLPNSARCSEDEVQLCLGNATWLVTDHCADTCDNGKCTVSFYKSGQFKFLIGTILTGIFAIVLIRVIHNRRKAKTPNRFLVHQLPFKRLLKTESFKKKIRVRKVRIKRRK